MSTVAASATGSRLLASPVLLADLPTVSRTQVRRLQRQAYISCLRQKVSDVCFARRMHEALQQLRSATVELIVFPPGRALPRRPPGSWNLRAFELPSLENLALSATDVSLPEPVTDLSDCGMFFSATDLYDGPGMSPASLPRLPSLCPFAADVSQPELESFGICASEVSLLGEMYLYLTAVLLTISSKILKLAVPNQSVLRQRARAPRWLQQFLAGHPDRGTCELPKCLLLSVGMTQCCA